MAETNKIKRRVNRECSSFDTYKIVYANRFGSFESAYFNKGRSRKNTISRNTYNRNLDYNYSIGDRGKTTYTNVSKDIHTFTSDFLPLKEYNYMENIFESPDVYHIVGYNTKLPIELTKNDFSEMFIWSKDFPSLDLEFEYAYEKILLTN